MELAPDGAGRLRDGDERREGGREGRDRGCGEPADDDHVREGIGD